MKYSMKTIYLNKLISLLLTITLLFCTSASQIQMLAADEQSISSISLPVEGTSSGAGTREIRIKNFNVDASNITDPHLKISIYIAKLQPVD